MTISQDISTIQLIGAGLPVWTSAALLASEVRSLPIQIVVVESGPDVSPLYATLPPIVRDFHEKVGIHEAQMLRAASGCFCVGSFVERQSTGAEKRFRRLGGELLGLEGVKAHHFTAIRGLQASSNGAFNVAELAARDNVFGAKSSTTSSPTKSLQYGYTVDPSAYCDLMKRCAIARGAVLAESPQEQSDLTLDLRPVLGEQHTSNWVMCSQYVPSYHAEFQFNTDILTTSVSSSEVHSQEGWEIRSSFVGGSVEIGLKTSPSNSISLKSGYTSSAWNEHTILLGPASGFLGAQAAQPSLILLQQLNWFSGLIPTTKSTHVEAREFNRLSKNLFERVLDFAAISENHVASEHLPKTAQRILKHFTARGHLCRFEGDPRNAGTWLDTLLELGHMPNRVNPMAYSFDEDVIDAQLAEWRLDLANRVAKMPPHDVYLKTYLEANSRKKIHA